MWKGSGQHKSAIGLHAASHQSAQLDPHHSHCWYTRINPRAGRRCCCLWPRQWAACQIHSRMPPTPADCRTSSKPHPKTHMYVLCILIRDYPWSSKLYLNVLCLKVLTVKLFRLNGSHCLHNLQGIDFSTEVVLLHWITLTNLKIDHVYHPLTNMVNPVLIN